MNALRLGNPDAASALVVRVWHRSNAFMSDGDSPWLDEDGAQTGERSRDHFVLPGETLELPVREELSFTISTDEAGRCKGPANALRDFFRTGSTDASGSGGSEPLRLNNETMVPLRVRVYASATFQFSPLHEFTLSPGQSTTLTDSGEGISVRVM